MKTLKIAFDASFNASPNSGTSVYSHNLLLNLAKLDKKNIYTIFPFFDYHFLSQFKNYQPKLPQNFSLFLNNTPKVVIDIIWNKFPFLKKFYLPKFDIFHSTTFSIPPKFMYRKLIVTIYDTTFYTHPQFHQQANINHCLQATQKAIKLADTIIAISQQTKNDLINYFNCSEDKIIVTPLACEKTFYKKVSSSQKKKVSEKFGLNKAYIFHLGSLEPRKNTLSLVKAYKLLPQKLQNEFDLVIAGGQGWLNHQIKNYINTHDLNNQIKMIGYINDKELPTLYQSAKCFAYPSFYEGFGIPPLEAMASGCPILTSDISSLPEVCGQTAIYCNPKDIEDISKKLKQILTQNNNDLIKKGLKQAQKFSWLKPAQQTLKIYQNT